MINYEEINENINSDLVIKLMEQLGADRYQEKENCIIFPTICHNINSNEASLKLYFYKDTKLFYCYTECGPMNIFKFMQHYYETRDINYDWYKDIYTVVINCSFEQKNSFSKQKKIDFKERYRKNNLKDLETYNPKILDVFIKKYPSEWLKDRITKSAMDKFNICYSISQNKIVIPHYDLNGNLIGIRGRALNSEDINNFGKYMPMQIENKWYSHPLSLNLYGLNINKENIKKYGYVYIFESEKSVLQLEDYSIPNCSVAVCGSNLNKFQVKILLKETAPKEIIICFDKEELPGSDNYFNKLWKMCKKYSKYCNFSFIYDRENLIKLKDSPSDCGEEVFKKLLEKRVKVK